MTAEIGLIALWLAAALATTQLALAAFAVHRDDATLTAAVRPIAIVQGGLALLAMAALVRVFLTSDMSVALVVANSHSARPWPDKVAGAWGNHDGAMLLWVTLLGVAGAAVALLERRIAERTLAATLGAQAAIALGFYAFLLFAANPFARLPNPPADGQGLNPLLPEPGLAFHTPMLDAGHVGLSVAFSFAVGALVSRDVEPAVASAIRQWVLGAWVFLTLGIATASYRTAGALGPGDWWPPVATASLVPWLAATALLHRVGARATRDRLRASTLVLAAVAFAAAMLATGLVRSRVAAAAGPVARDGAIGPLPLLGLALAAGLAVVSVVPLFGRDLRRTPLAVYGMVVAHLGIAVSLAGMAASSAFAKERLVAAGIDQPTRIGPYRIVLRGIRPVIGDNWTALEARLEAQRGDAPAVLLKPQSRFFPDPPTTTTQGAILTAPDGRLATLPGEPDARGRWRLRLRWTPWVTLIWLGGALMALGGALSLAGHVRHDRRQQRRAVEAADAAAYRAAWEA